mgnify:CR=1 FL=1
MFSDRFWSAKAGLAIGVFAILCWKSERDFKEIFPDVEGVILKPEAFAKATIHLWARPVLSTADDGFFIQTKGGPFHVTGPLRPSVGDYVSLVGRVTGSRRLEASKARIQEGYLWKRPLTYAVSAAVLAAFLWLARRRFRWDLAQGLFRSKT